MDIGLIIAIYLISSASFTLSQLAGGGGSLIIFPMLVFLGVPAPVAIGSFKFSTLGSITGIYKYAKSGKIDWKRTPVFILISIVATFFGTQLLLSVDPTKIKHFFGVITLLILPFIFFKSKWGLTSLKHAMGKKHRIIGNICYFFVSIIQSAFGAGLGLLVTYIFVSFHGYTLIEANATRRIPLYILNGSSAIVFAFAGIVNFKLGIILFAGALTGNYIGAHISIIKGNKFVKYFFTGLILVSAIKLLFV